MLEQIQNKHVFIDGDIVKYRCAASAEKTKYVVVEYMEGLLIAHEFEDHKSAKSYADETNAVDVHSKAEVYSRKVVQPVEFALQACKTTIDALLDKLTPKSVSIFLSPASNFRDKIAVTKPYKGNRQGVPKPKYLKDVEKYIISNYAGRMGDNVEADDEIGIALSNDPANSVSVSIDKDLLQIPGWHYNWVSDTVRRITPKQGDWNFYTQMLTGDVTDNIPGLDGYGPKKASTVLDGARSRVDLATRVWGEYKRQLGDSERSRAYYREQADLLWIRRKEGAYKCPIELV